MYLISLTGSVVYRSRNLRDSHVRTNFLSVLNLKKRVPGHPISLLSYRILELIGRIDVTHSMIETMGISGG